MDRSLAFSSFVLVSVFSIGCTCVLPDPLATQRLLLILLDGLHPDYLKQPDLPLRGFNKIIVGGAMAEAFIPDFPTLSYPNYYTIMTGLHTESHGMTGNYMYDYTRNESFLIGTNPEQFHAHWWDGGDPLWTTAVRQGKKVYMYYWCGCEVEIRGFRPTHCSPYSTNPTIEEFSAAVNKSLDLLRNGTADVAAVYFEDTDSVAHHFGPFSEELNQVLRDLDPIMYDLAVTLSSDPALRDVNLMVFSDHGMAEISEARTISISKVLSPDDYYTVLDRGAVVSIYTIPGKEDEVYNKLQNFHPNMTVYRQSDLPERWHYKKGKYVAPVTAVADLGWFILNPSDSSFPVRKSDGQPMKGWHGYDNDYPDLYGTFIAMGPFFKSESTPPIHAVDVYKLMCDVLNINASPNNGSWFRVNPLRRIEELSLGCGASRMTSPAVLTLITLCLMFLLHEDF